MTLYSHQIKPWALGGGAGTLTHAEYAGLHGRAAVMDLADEDPVPHAAGDVEAQPDKVLAVEPAAGDLGVLQGKKDDYHDSIYTT